MKFLNYILILAVALTSASCKKFLDKQPEDFISDPKEFYDTEDRLNSTIASVYEKMGAIHGTAWLYTLGNEADEGYYARGTNFNMPAFFNFSAGNAAPASTWSDCYQGINRANAFLENVDNNPAISETFRNRLRGEAHFLRGYYYFLLVQIYGGVPIRTESTIDATQNFNKKRSTVAEVYELILSDMKIAESLVPTIDAIGNGGRVSKSAARGLLARICLTMAGFPLKDESKYIEARDWAKMVIDDPIHGLNPDFTNIFVRHARDEYDIRESIFEVEFWGNRTDVYTETGYVGYANQPIHSNPNTGNGFGGLKVTYKLWKQFTSPNDMRRDWTIANFSYSNPTKDNPSLINGTKAPVTAVTESSIYNRQAAKWRREYETLIPKATGATPQNFPVLRYSDILLMYAEAENAINHGPTTEAFNKLNEVRRRAYGTGYRIATITKGAAGSGYTLAPMIVIKNSDGNQGAQAYAYATLTNGTINTITLLSKGAFYGSTPPTVSFVPVNGVGSGATATVTVQAINPAEANITVDLGMDQYSFLQIIQAERMREFAFEQMRKFDLIRWGIFADAMGEVANAMYSTPPAESNSYSLVRFQNAMNIKHTLWPIPSVEIMMNRDMVQNPNW